MGACPLCHSPTRGDAGTQCSCGYEFGQSPEKAIELLLSQRRNASINLVLLLGALGGAVATIIAAGPIIIAGPLFGVLALKTARTVRTLSITRESLRQLRMRQLPKAQLLLRD
ncbi:MAG: hypothetical protein SFX73_35200 [Kofleriaceae bacterium]|nr:hypothetical protein [Kofleriaceae bacterium]